MTETKRCVRHPDVSTNLACSRCGDLICTRCMVETPVGMRCPRCANVRRPPTFDVSAPYLARAVAAAILTAGAGSVAFIFLSSVIWFPFMGAIGLLLIGLLIGEGISVAVNRKRGRALKYVAGIAMVAAFVVVSAFGPISLNNIWNLLSGFIAVYVAVNRF